MSLNEISVKKRRFSLVCENTVDAYTAQYCVSEIRECPTGCGDCKTTVICRFSQTREYRVEIKSTVWYSNFSKSFKFLDLKSRLIVLRFFSPFWWSYGDFTEWINVAVVNICWVNVTTKSNQFSQCLIIIAHRVTELVGIVFITVKAWVSIDYLPHFLDSEYSEECIVFTFFSHFYSHFFFCFSVNIIFLVRTSSPIAKCHSTKKCGLYIYIYQQFIFRKKFVTNTILLFKI